MATETDVARRELTARRAYEIWERSGHPNDRAWEHWLQAEREIDEERHRSDGGGSGSPFADALEHDKRPRHTWQEARNGGDAVHGLTDAPRSGERDSIEGDGRIDALGDAPPASNLDRALPAGERAQARRGRQGKEGQSAPQPPPAEHFVVLADYASLRIFVEERAPGQRTPALRSLQTQLFPQGHENYSDRDTSQQGRFPNSGLRGGAPGQGIDERLPMQREQERRLVSVVAAALGGFLRQHPNATWDFAAGPSLHRAVLDALEPRLRTNLRKALVKDLGKQPLSSLRVHFAGTVSPS